RTAHRMISRGNCRPEKMPMDLIIPRRSSYCPNFATAPARDVTGFNSNVQDSFTEFTCPFPNALKQHGVKFY
ncbi:hypothetical protein, partial [Corynebacterium riegelii]|uniref:hypothetical protein n=1 Tax=Corynebacterium riegelii TaxID=156976 RepID=UPI001C60EBAB